MTTEDIIESFIEEGVKSYKKLYRPTPLGRSLDMHETVNIKGNVFTCWRELTVFKMGEYLYENFPELYVEVVLNDNNSTLRIENITDEQQQKLNNMLYCFLKQFKAI